MIMTTDAHYKRRPFLVKYSVTLFIFQQVLFFKKSIRVYIFYDLAMYKRMLSHRTTRQQFLYEFSSSI